MILYNAIRTPDGTVIRSFHRHDFVMHEDANGNTYAVDGGLDYLRRLGPFDYEELSLTTEDDFSKVREVITWGTRGKDGKQPLSYIKVKDMELSHIQSVLDLQYTSDNMRFVLESELNFRKDK